MHLSEQLFSITHREAFYKLVIIRGQISSSDHVNKDRTLICRQLEKQKTLKSLAAQTYRVGHCLVLYLLIQKIY